MAPIRVCVTGAAGQIGYSLLQALSNGSVFGATTPVVLQLLDIPPALEVLNGVVMELEDSALPLLHGVIATTDPKIAFKDADYALFLGAMPRKAGMERKDLLIANAGIFKDQGQALNEVAKPDVKILVVGNPANTNALILQHYAPSIPKENFTALTRLDQNRALTQIALRVKVPVASVRNVSIWGNHSATQFPDVNHGYVADFPNVGDKTPIRTAVKDDAYLDGDFIKVVQQRGAAVIAARKLSSAMSAAKAIADHVHDWHNGTAPGSYVSMGVYSDGSYGVPSGLIYSFPVTISGGKWSIVQGLPVTDFARGKLDATAKELTEEKNEALSFLTKA